MNKIPRALALVLAAAPLALARGDAESTIWVTNVDGTIDGGWVVGFPTGSSDFFSNRYTVVPGSGNSESVVDGLPITGIALSVADYQSGRKFPIVGVFYSNLTIDPSGITPDLGQPISSVTSPPISAPHLLAFVPL